ncbi:antitoxin family protein [Archaeoglobus sp.]
MPRVRVRYEGGVLVPIDKLDLKEGEILEIEIKDKLSNKLREFVGIVKKENLDKLEEAYYDYVLERSSIR